MKELTHKDCDYLLLCKLPDGKVFQVLIDQQFIKDMLSGTGAKLMLIDEELPVDFKVKKV